jgi:hypothetical protein
MPREAQRFAVKSYNSDHHNAAGKPRSVDSAATVRFTYA